MTEPLKADEDLITKLAKNIFRADVATEQYFTTKFTELSREDFIIKFNKAIELTWTGKEDIDSLERERYRLLALSALKTLGYEIDIPNQPVKAVLV